MMPLKLFSKARHAVKSRTDAYNLAKHSWVCASCYTKHKTKPTTCEQCADVMFYYFASQKENDRFNELRILERAGLISDLKMQITYPLNVNGQTIGAYRADFEYIAKGKKIVEDVKAKSKNQIALSEAFKIKCKLMKAIYDIDVKIVEK